MNIKNMPEQHFCNGENGIPDIILSFRHLVLDYRAYIKPEPN